jgi:hypothetical protein
VDISQSPLLGAPPTDAELSSLAFTSFALALFSFGGLFLFAVDDRIICLWLNRPRL